MRDKFRHNKIKKGYNYYDISSIDIKSHLNNLSEYMAKDLLSRFEYINSVHKNNAKYWICRYASECISHELECEHRFPHKLNKKCFDLDFCDLVKRRYVHCVPINNKGETK